MKTILITLYTCFLLGCDSEAPSNKKAIEEPGMFTMFKGTMKNYVISSPMEGVLMKNGKPSPNTKIIRRLRWNGNEEGLEEEFITDDNGRFSLPIHEEALSLGMLNQFVSSTQIDVNIDGQTVDVWYNNKFEEGLHAETEGPLIGLVCDMSADEVVVEPGLSKIVTICRWKEMPKSEI